MTLLPSWFEIALLIIAGSGVLTAALTWRLTAKAEEMRTALNGRMKELLETTRVIAEAQGRKDEKRDHADRMLMLKEEDAAGGLEPQKHQHTHNYKPPEGGQ